MRHDEIQIGKTYRAKVSDKLTTVRVDRIEQGFRGRGWRYYCTNLTTKRQVVFRSAQKFRVEVQPYGGSNNTGRVGVEVKKVEAPDLITVVDDPFAEASEATLDGKISEEANPTETSTTPSEGGVQSVEDTDVDITDESEGEHSPDPTQPSQYQPSSTPVVRSQASSQSSPSTGTNDTSENSAEPGSTRSTGGGKSGLSAMLRSKIKKPLRVIPNSGTEPTVVAHEHDPLSSREHRRSGLPPHLMVKARAGTGKTTTLIGGLDMVTGGIPKITPSEQQALVWDSLEESKGARFICMCAYNTSIARVLKDRVPQGVEAKTMHGLGYRSVLKSMGKLEVPDDDRLVTYLIMEELTGLDIRVLREKDPILPSAAAELVRLCKVTLSDPTEDNLDYLIDRYDVEVGTHRDNLLELVPDILKKCKDPKSRGMIDYSDMVWLPVILDLPVFRYDLLLIDEFQDLGRCQHALARKMGKRLVMCGDDRQAIYGFTGADTQSMARMLKELDDTPAGCVELPLTVTRRCGKAIVEEARRIVPDFSYFPDTHEGKISHGKYTTQRSSNYWDQGVREIPYEDTYLPTTKDGDMVLCRTNAPLVNQCFRLLKKGRRAMIQGRRIGDDLVNLVNRMGAESVPDLIGKLDEWRFGEITKEQAKKMPSETRIMGINDRADCVMCFTDGQLTVEGVIHKIKSLFTDDTVSPGVKFSSIHKAKGLESERVYFLQPEESPCPHPSAKMAWQLEQEYNLLYVGVTRAIHELTYVS
jgi:DNA helicase-2/ATP-dependent DNA helicase PcrA